MGEAGATVVGAVEVVLVVSLYSVVGWLGGGCECYACGAGVEVASDE